MPGDSGKSLNLLHCTLGKASYATRLQSQCMTPGGGGVDWHGFELTATGKGGVSCSGGILYSPESYQPSYSTLCLRALLAVTEASVASLSAAV